MSAERTATRALGDGRDEVQHVRTPRPVGVLNFSRPGDFEQHMPGIVQWFIDNPPTDAVT